MIKYSRDPILRHLPEDKPLMFTKLPDAEQRWRGRYAIVMWTAGFPMDMVWDQATSEGAKKSLVPPDSEILRMLTDAATWEKSERKVIDDDEPKPLERLQGMLIPKAAVHATRLPDFTWLPVGVWLGVPKKLFAMYRPEPEWQSAMNLILQNAVPPVLNPDDPNSLRGTWADWPVWAAKNMGNDYVDGFKEVKPELTVDMLYQREVLGRKPKKWRPEDLPNVASEIPTGLKGYKA